MNVTRHEVVWLSANTWAYGSIYGTVQFTFPWDKIVNGRRMYWVEAMEYGNPAYRVLVTNKEVSHLTFLTPYDPEVDKGPVRFRNGTWYWNHKYTSEFMVDSDLDLTDCISFKGIDHKKDGCRIYGRNCREREELHYITGGRMLAFLLSAGLHHVNPALRAVPAGMPSRQFSYEMDNAARGLWFSLVQNKHVSLGGPIKKADSSRGIVMGALALHGADQVNAARNLVNLLHDEATFQAALEAIVNDHFGISGWKLPG